MSDVYPGYTYQTYTSPTTDIITTSGSSCTWWIVLFVLFLLVAIGFAIWLLVLYLGGHVGSGGNRIVTLSGASITADGTSITGTWGALNNINDKVTLYVSEKPFIFNDNGDVINANSTVQQDFQVGPNGKITITVKNNTAYNAMMIVTGDNTVHYRVFGPKKVFTQIQANLGTNKFHIQNLNSCNGAVSDAATYTTVANAFGMYRLGSANNTNPDSSSLLLKFNEPQDTETDQVLCRTPSATQLTQVGFGYWVNRLDNSNKPVICSVPNATNTDELALQCDNSSNAISLENCQWSYNSEPTTMSGQNQWCLRSVGSTTINSSITNPLCLAVNGQALAVNNGLTNTDTWFNQIIYPTLSVLN
jgi:hypothetical protein